MEREKERERGRVRGRERERDEREREGAREKYWWCMKTWLPSLKSGKPENDTSWDSMFTS